MTYKENGQAPAGDLSLNEQVDDAIVYRLFDVVMVRYRYTFRENRTSYCECSSFPG